jgi:hypothetical protein
MTWASGLVERSGRLPEARRASADVDQRRPHTAPVCSGNQPRKHIAWYRYVTLVMVAHVHLAFLSDPTTAPPTTHGAQGRTTTAGARKPRRPGRVSGHDVDQALRLWQDGVDPLRVRELKVLADNGISFRDLKVMVQGKTIMKHLADGQPPQWCIEAVRWERRDRSTL